MPVWHIKSGGTRVVASGASTADDWTDANCFDDDSNLNEWWRILRDHMADGDEIIFYDADDGSTVVTHDIEPGNLVSHATTGTFTLKSRSGDASQCVVRANVDAVTLMDLKPTTSGIYYVLDGLSVHGFNGDYTSANTPLISVEKDCSGLTINNCRLGNVNLAVTGSEQLQGIINADNLATRTISFTGTNYIEDITSTATWYGGSYIGQFMTGNTVSIAGTLYIRDITLTPVNNIRGGFFDNADISITGTVNISNINNTVPTTKFNRSVFYTGGDFTVTGNIVAASITLTGGTSGAAVAIVTSTFNLNATSGWTIDASNITITQGTSENSVGTVFVALGSSATGYARKLRGKNLTGFSGGICYHSAGGNGTMESLYVTDSTMGENGAVCYSGGDGDTDMIGIYGKNCTANEGGGIFIHNNSATRAKTVTVKNVTLIDCEATSGSNGHSIWVNNADATYSLTSTIENAVIRGKNGTDEINLGEGASATHTATVDNCDINGSTAAIDDADITNGSSTITNIVDDSTQSKSDGTLVADSAYRTAGNYLRYGSRDANGRMFSLPVPLGAFGPASNVANTRTARS